MIDRNTPKVKIFLTFLWFWRPVWPGEKAMVFQKLGMNNKKMLLRKAYYFQSKPLELKSRLESRSHIRPERLTVLVGAAFRRD